MLEAAFAPFFVTVDDDFGVRASAKVVTASFECRAQLREVVDFAVVDDPDAPVLVVDGLPAAAEVDDAQPPHAQHRERFGEYAVLIGPAVNHCGHHSADASFGQAAFTADRAADAAHAVLLYRGLVGSSTASPKEFAVA